MMRLVAPRRTVPLALAVCLVATSGLADGADLTGMWTWSQRLDANEVAVWTLDLKQEGEKRTGTWLAAGGNSQPIENGRVSNGEFSFEVVATRPGGVWKSVYSGKLNGVSIESKVDGEHDGTVRQGTKIIKAKRVAR